MSTESPSLGIIIDYLPIDFKKFNQLGYKNRFPVGKESLSKIAPYMEAKILHACGWFRPSKLIWGELDHIFLDLNEIARKKSNNYTP